MCTIKLHDEHNAPEGEPRLYRDSGQVVTKVWGPMSKDFLACNDFFTDPLPGQAGDYIALSASGTGYFPLPAKTVDSYELIDPLADDLTQPSGLIVISDSKYGT